MEKNRYCDPIGPVQDLGHNASVCIAEVLYVPIDGPDFYKQEVSISDKRVNAILTTHEALNLLAWLERNKTRLEELASKENNT